MKKENNGIKFIIFILVAALTSVLFFGLGESPKEELELVAFYFIILAELAVYISNIIPGMLKNDVLKPGDLVASTSLYAFASFLLNIAFLEMIDEVKHLVVYNVALLIILLLIISIVYMVKSNNQK